MAVDADADAVDVDVDVDVDADADADALTVPRVAAEIMATARTSRRGPVAGARMGFLLMVGQWC
ncbi:hypothetical protein ACFVW1_11150 [Streptomyces olivochromogenes]|uniref:hypothetical protein n=1 Tax=Streptomyces olivochromogenes TaxID=1963 RepID=UPI0036DC2C2A